MATTPKDLLYSQALKPVSIASTTQARKFLPITSGTYSASSNNIIRIPVNANAFVDLKNAMLRYEITNTNAGYFNGAHAPISRLNILSPDGAPLETIDNYNRLYQFMLDLDANRDYVQGLHNLLEGSSHQGQQITISSSAATNSIISIDGAIVGTLDWTSGATVLRVGDWIFTKTDAVVGTIEYRGTSVALPATTGVVAIGANTFSFTVAAGAYTAVSINDVAMANGGCSTGLQNPSHAVSTLNSTNEAYATTTTRTYSHNLLSCLTKLDVLYPAFAIGGGGVIIEITLAPNAEVYASPTTTACTYAIAGVELHAPVIQYPESVVMAFKQMVQQMGAVSMSSVSFQNFQYPFAYAGSGINLTIPLAMRNRSLKALYFYFDGDEATVRDNALARSCPTSMNFQLRVGSQYFPASPVYFSTAGGTGGLTDAVEELAKSVSKLADVRHGSSLNRKVFTLTKTQGGKAIYGIDLESSAVSYMESGINTADNSLTMYLEINSCSFPANLSGVVQIYGLFDNTLSILSNGNLVQTR